MALTYEEQLRFLEATVDGAVAERQGFSDARIFSKPAKWSSVSGLQWRYEVGFVMGKKLRGEETNP